MAHRHRSADYARVPNAGRSRGSLYGCAFLEDRAASHKSDSRDQSLQYAGLSGDIGLRTESEQIPTTGHADDGKSAKARAVRFPLTVPADERRQDVSEP